MSVTKVQAIHVLDRTIRCDDGSVAALASQSPHVWIETTKGTHRFEVMDSGWLRLRAEVHDPARELIRQACVRRSDIALELEAAPWNAYGTVRAIKSMTEWASSNEETGAWTALATSYKCEGVVTQSGVVSRDMLLTIQTFGATSKIASVEVNLGVVIDVIVNIV